MRQICLDTETTGLDPKQGHRVIEIGCVEMINRRVTDNHFHCYINPNRHIEEGAQAVHGISGAFLADKPVFSDIVLSFIEYLQDADEIIIHNAPFDVGFLDHEFALLKKKMPKLANYAQVIDTLVMARQLHPGQKNSLDALCKRYSVDNSHRELHGALVDADLLARVYLVMTGGQDSLFSEEVGTHAKKTTSSRKNRSVKRHGEIPIIRADQQELALHAEYMVELSEDK